MLDISSLKNLNDDFYIYCREGGFDRTPATLLRWFELDTSGRCHIDTIFEFLSQVEMEYL